MKCLANRLKESLLDWRCEAVQHRPGEARFCARCAQRADAFCRAFEAEFAAVLSQLPAQ